MSRKPRAAGATFERRIASELRVWLGDDWSVLRNQTDRQKGQGGCAGEYSITHDRLAFPYAIECKTYATAYAAQLWEPTKQWHAFWAQAVRQANSVGLAPLLVSRQGSRGKTVCIVREGDALLEFVKGPRMTTVLHGERVEVVLWSAVMDSPAKAWPMMEVA